MRAAAIAWVGLGAAGLGLVGACNLISGQSKLSYEMSGSGGSAPAGCDPTMLTSAVADICGVFVSSSLGNDTIGKGTKEAPYQTFDKALSMSNGKPVYACDETFRVTASVKLSAPVSLYGGLACSSGWVHDSMMTTTLQADADATPIPLTLTSGASGSSVNSFSIFAADATQAGGSSIVILDDGADLTLTDVDLHAGSGMAGTAGAAPPQYSTPGAARGGNGTYDGTCDSNSVPGGAEGTNTCYGTLTNGGVGGQGLASPAGGAGGNGVPTMTPGNGGAGQASGGQCAAGIAGSGGATGMTGTCAHGIGTISASGYQPPSAMPAGPGSPGQGGGGGGGAYGCDPGYLHAGPSGGGGGAGGCGGEPGNPATSGGSSIGVLILNATLTTSGVEILTQAGGAGGLGGDGEVGLPGGEPGAAGAASGLPGVDACPGGAGGQGGSGGPGGGGAGGHSLAIAMMGGTLPTDVSATLLSAGTAGMGGGGGNGITTAQVMGDNGVACAVFDFGNPTNPCPM